MDNTIRISPQSRKHVKQKTIEFLDGLYACGLKRNEVILFSHHDRIEINVRGRKIWVVQVHGYRLSDGGSKQWVEEHHFGDLPAVPEHLQMWFPKGSYYTTDGKV